MISVLIPTYDWDVTALCHGLHEQFLKTGIPFEILVSENCPDSPFVPENQTLNNLSFCTYHIESKEVGRSANRNALANKAKFGNLLFLDGDTALPDAQFARRYLDCLGKSPVICGGTIYASNPPENPQKMLRWHYGKAKEEVPVNIRSQMPYRFYSSFNFLIDKQLFFKIGFDTHLKQYGHEDTLFGRQLKALKIPILHLNNPLLHLGLDDAGDFMEKTRWGVENLYNLGCTGRIDAEVRLFAWYQETIRWGLTKPIAKIFALMKKTITKNLISNKPAILLFDFYKLGYLCSLHLKHQGLPTLKSS